MKLISKITIDCVEHEDDVYFRWDEDDWRIQTSYDEMIPLTEECEWLEDLFQQAKSFKDYNDLDDLDVMKELGG